MKHDVIIIGGGIVGCSASYFLAKKGIHSLVIEKGAGVGLEASGRNGGGVRQQGRKAALPLAMKSVNLWATLQAELGADLEYSRVGNLKLATDTVTAEVYEKEIQWEHQNGLMDVRLLTDEECREIIPGVNKPIIVGKLCTSDGIANPMLASPAFAIAGRKMGVRFQTMTKVVSLLRQGKNVCGVKTTAGEMEANIVINAAGPWAAQFMAEVGCPIVIGPGRSQLMISARLRNPLVRPWVTVSSIGYIRSTRSGNIVLGSAGTRNDQYKYFVDYSHSCAQTKRWSDFFSWMKDLTIIRAFTGITEYTPDGEPYIGAVPEAPGLFVAAGFDGQGFCPGPYVGKLLAEMVTGALPEVSLEAFRPERYATDLLAGKSAPIVSYPLDKMLATGKYL